MRYTKTQWTMHGDRAVTYDNCTICGGPINNNSISNPSNLNAWVHLQRQDWAQNLHQAAPKGGPVTEDELETSDARRGGDEPVSDDPPTPS
ncbi:Uncharacterised protein [Mycobacteroides abscessus subsp. massiliense]|uniref:hypothetical protein n=1 Tax=Mycobacteroides abscessus TaxID=36809 RepID=UPI0009A7EFCA|nr:hypothetical protein [Mycobacteroides abscessus]SLE84183.1 Uncharacterised protein [Mycobacteroides abscessus subsp. massiliense]